MAEQNEQQEPSMEEILASIRRIISEDGEEEGENEAAPEAAAQPEPAPPPPPEPEPEPAAEPEPEPVAAAEPEDVLELTDEVQDDGTVVNLKTGDVLENEADQEGESAPTEGEEGVELEMVEAAETEVQPEPAPAAAPAAEPPPAAAAPAADDERLISQNPAVDSVNSLAALAAAMDTHRRATDPSIGSRTIEDLVKEVMRPMIREWLDAHLPGLVERLVGREIERLTRDAEDISQR